ncbi:hypothetical protein [Chryseobacterium sp.]|uniref:hypothetical protein n=1 Tax=Chryseobacterium sp. TaxID=1871047 RepID=UPI0035B385C2
MPNKESQLNVSFLGLKKQQTAKEILISSQNYTMEQKAFVAGQTVLVQALMNTQIGQGVRITCTGSTKTTGGNNIPLFDVDELNINLFDNAD